MDRAPLFGVLPLQKVDPRVERLIAAAPTDRRLQKLGRGGALRVYGALTKIEENDDGTVYVEGVASSETRDRQGEIVTAAAMKKAIPGFLRSDGTGPVREMHDLKAAGKTVAVDVADDGRTYVAAVIVDPVACLKVKTNVYQGFSIGGTALKRNAQDRTIVEELQWTELSLVDRGANPDATFTLVKVH